MAKTSVWKTINEADLASQAAVKNFLRYASDTGRLYIHDGTDYQNANTAHRGAWSNTFAYKKQDLATYQGSTWRALQAHIGQTPAENAYWTLFNAKGDPGTNGANGNTVLSGSGAPSSGLGVNGDYYIDTTAHAIYGPKTAGAWGSATSLIGPGGTPSDGSVTDVKVAAAAAIAESKLALASDAAVGTASRRTLGTGALQAAAGNDSRITGAVQTTRTLTTTAPLTGGGDLSANRTLAISAATTAAPGSMSAADKSKLDNTPIFVLSRAGSIAATVTGGTWLEIAGARTLTSVRCVVDVAPTASTTVSVKRRTTGGTVTEIATVTIAISAIRGQTTGLSVALADGDQIRIDVTAGGTGASGLTVQGYDA